FAAWLHDARLATTRFAALHRPVAYGLAVGVLSIFAIDALAGQKAGGAWISSPTVTSLATLGLFAAIVANAAAELGRPATSAAAPPGAPAPGTKKARGRLAIAIAAALSIGIPALLVVEKERLLAEGAPILLELRPRDPRSLMQGDYMELRYALADVIPRQGLA